MARADIQTVRTAKANVARWLSETPAGTVFLPGDGRALQVTAEEAIAIRAGAETKIVAITRQVNRRAVLHVVMIVLVFGVVSSWADGLPGGWRTLGNAACYALYAVHGLGVAYEFWRWERTIFLLREAIAHSLRGRASLPAAIVGPRARPEPNYRLLHNIAFGLMGLVLIIEAGSMMLDDVPGAVAVQGIAAMIGLAAIGGIAAIMLYVIGVTARR